MFDKSCYFNHSILPLNYHSLGLEETSDDAIPEEKTYYKGGTVKGGMIREIEAIVATMNEDGREALLRHARELAQIPAYQKETENL